MIIEVRTITGGHAFFTHGDNALIFQHDNRVLLNLASRTTLELDPVLMTRARYRAMLLWLSEAYDPDHCDFTNPNAIIMDGKDRIETASPAQLGQDDGVTLQQQLTAAGYTVAPPK